MSFTSTSLCKKRLNEIPKTPLYLEYIGLFSVKSSKKKFSALFHLNISITLVAILFTSPVHVSLACGGTPGWGGAVS